MQSFIIIAISITVGTILGVVSNLVADIIQPHVAKLKKLIISLFLGLLGCSILLAGLSEDGISGAGNDPAAAFGKNVQPTLTSTQDVVETSATKPINTAAPNEPTEIVPSANKPEPNINSETNTPLNIQQGSIVDIKYFIIKYKGDSIGVISERSPITKYDDNLSFGTIYIGGSEKYNDQNVILRLYTQSGAVEDIGLTKQQEFIMFSSDKKILYTIKLENVGFGARSAQVSIKTQINNPISVETPTEPTPKTTVISETVSVDLPALTWMGETTDAYEDDKLKISAVKGVAKDVFGVKFEADGKDYGISLLDNTNNFFVFRDGIGRTYTVKLIRYEPFFRNFQSYYNTTLLITAEE